MKNFPNIKILILNWNGMAVIGKCLESVSKLKYNNYSVCMIDNGSIDESLTYVKEKFPNIEILALNKNYGYSKGYNFIFKKYINNTEIDYYLILNNDTVLCDTNLLNILNNSLKKYGNDNIYSPTILDNNNKIWFGGGKLIKLLGYTKHIGLNKMLNFGKYKTRKIDYISGCCMLVKKDLIDQLEGFSENYTMYYEDVDLCIRAKNNNIDCYIVDDAKIIHDFSSSFSGRFKFKKIFSKFKSLLIFIYLNNNFIFFIPVLLFHLVLFPIYLIIYSMKVIFRK